MRINELLTELETVSYPNSTDGVITELNDPELQLPDGTDRLSSIFDRVEIASLDSSDDAKLALQSGVNTDALGRRYYSDRDPPGLGEENSDRVSL